MLEINAGLDILLSWYESSRDFPSSKIVQSDFIYMFSRRRYSILPHDGTNGCTEIYNVWLKLFGKISRFGTVLQVCIDTINEREKSMKISEWQM